MSEDGFEDTLAKRPTRGADVGDEAMAFGLSYRPKVKSRLVRVRTTGQYAGVIENAVRPSELHIELTMHISHGSPQGR